MARQLILDTETTGIDPAIGHRIIDIGIVEYDGLMPTGREYQVYLNPDRAIEASATAIHGITNEMLQSSPRFADIAEELLDFLGNDPIIIYNAPFDIGFLNAELEAINLAGIENPIIDPMEIVKKRYPRANKSLNAVAKRLGVSVEGRDKHGAIIDATITGHVYRRLIQQDELAIANVEEVKAAPRHSQTIDARPIARTMCSVGPYLLRSETSYSLFQSALSPESLVKNAKELGYQGVALTDRYTIAGAMNFASAVRKAEIKGAVGVALDIASHPDKPLIFYARNETGWRNIQKLITLRNVTNQGRGLTSKQMQAHAEGIAVLSGGAEGPLDAMLQTSEGAVQAMRTANFLKALYHDAFAIEISRTNDSPERHVETQLTIIADELKIPIIGTAIARAANGEPEMVELMRAIGHGTNYEESMNSGEDLKRPATLTTMFSDLPNAAENAGWLMDRCEYLPAEVKPILPSYPGIDCSEDEMLIAKAREGLGKHLKNIPEDQHEIYWKRFEYETGLICSQGFSGYFLIVADFINWAHDNDIPVGPGRGSGAGSIVAWALGITKLDPIAFNLLFERFINPDRVSLPDFDIDFCEEGRESVIKYVREKYGADRVVAIGTYGTFQSRMGVKDVGRILGQPHGLMDRIAKALPEKGELTRDVIESEEVQRLLTTAEAAKAVQLSAKLYGLVRNKSRHAAGIVIADRPVDSITSLEPDPNDPEQSVTQYDMKPVEKAGLVKFDFLGLKTLSIIDRATKSLAERGIDIDPYALPLNDEMTFQALSQGHTTAVFQMESPGITRACREIRIDSFEDIVAIVALYRPGPMEFIPLYARRKKGLEPFGTPHPLLDNVTRDTYGILVYQEQVMQAAQVLAGYSLGQADLLRRAMGKKIKAEMDAQREVFIKGCKQTNNIGERQATELFELIERFAMYGFNRSHAAAYALLCYITSWLINHYPADYIAAAMDSVTDNTDQMVKFAQEARRRGIKLIPPVIDDRADRFRAIDGKTIRWSLKAIRGIGRRAVQAMVQEAGSQPFKNVPDFIERNGAHISRTQAQLIAASGALDQLAGGRSEAVTLIRQHYDSMVKDAEDKRIGQQSLFGEEQPMPKASDDVAIDERELIDLEAEALGLTLTTHPIDEYRAYLMANGILTPSQAQNLLDTMPVRIAAQVDEIKNAKGKAWMTVRLSDDQATITAGCDETLDNAHQLKKGSLYILQVSAYHSGGERKVRIDQIESELSEPEENTHRICIIKTGEGFDRNQLRKLIAGASEGQDRLRIVEDGQATNTPAIVRIDDTLIRDIEALDGVEETAVM